MNPPRFFKEIKGTSVAWITLAFVRTEMSVKMATWRSDVRNAVAREAAAGNPILSTLWDGSAGMDHSFGIMRTALMEMEYTKIRPACQFLSTGLINSIDTTSYPGYSPPEKQAMINEYRRGPKRRRMDFMSDPNGKYLELPPRPSTRKTFSRDCFNDPIVKVNLPVEWKIGRNPACWRCETDDCQ